MVKICSAASAKRVLANCVPEHEFWVVDGERLKNMAELAKALVSMDSAIFKSHDMRGDFSNWLRDIIGDDRLAKDMQINRSRESAVKKVRARLNFLKKLAQR